ncbi:unnamed protein product [[Candida] boidinii]|uniref:Unnamed protein product n=1 Tax=Candida boidinii TaxID=5477 RepID=A0ACB5TG36_CANBO|nr:unnamed protein product [[Candida] boidinii]
MALEDISTNLINIADLIINETQESKLDSSNEYQKYGRKYVQIADGNFMRVRNETKFLIIGDTYAEYRQNLSILSSYYILKNFCGSLLQDYKDLCLAIIFCSREIELNKWYEENSKVVTLANAIYDPNECETEALNYISNCSSEKRDEYIKIGSQILCASKINFLQTDHHVAQPNLEGYALKELIKDVCGTEGLKSTDVYNALRAFVHWCSIRGVLYKLDVGGSLKLNTTLRHHFKSFPDPPNWIKETITNRFPAGTSKISLINKSLITIGNSVFGKLITIPQGYDLDKIFDLCDSIQKDPVRYHIRAQESQLTSLPPNEISNIVPDLQRYVLLCASILHGSEGKIGSKLLVSSKFPRFNQVKNLDTYAQSHKISQRIKQLSKSKRQQNQYQNQNQNHNENSSLRILSNEEIYHEIGIAPNNFSDLLKRHGLNTDN